MMTRSLSLTVLAAFLVFCVSIVHAVGEQTPLVPSTPHTSASWRWEDCGDPSDGVEIKSLTISPDPPKPGQNLTVHAEGYVSTTIVEGAYADVTVKLGLIKLLSKTFDICKEADNANVTLKCPVKEGDHDVKHTVALPREIPPAKFTVEVRAYNADEAPLMCANIKVDFLPGITSGLFRS